MEMAKNRLSRILALAALFVFFFQNAQAQYLWWNRAAVNGSRTGVVEAMPGKVSEALGRVDGRRYYAPSGKFFRGGSVYKVASDVIEAQSVMAASKEVVGYCPEGMIKSSPESGLTNWFIDRLMAYTGELAGKPVDVGIANFGGVRVDMPKGNVLLDDILSMFPFKNNLCYLELYGRDLRVIFEQMASVGFEIIGGARCEVKGRRLHSATIGGKPLEDGKLYSVATISFLLNGGDGYFIGRNAQNLVKFDKYVIDAILPYVRSLTAEGKNIEYHTDGRVSILDAPKKDPNLSKSLSSMPDAGRENNPLYTADGSEAKPPYSARRGRKLTILHLNDTHSHIDPLRSGLEIGMGGVIEQAAYIDSVRRADRGRNVLLLHAGDFSQGTSYFTKLGGDIEISLLNDMGFDAVALGNHEFDNGVEELTRRVKNLNMPVLCANYDFSEFELGSYVKPYVILRRGGRKIGVFGMLTDVSKVLERSIADKLHALDNNLTANKIAAYLKNVEHCDLVIALTHLGFSGEAYTDADLIKSTRNIDLVIGGHSHTFLTDLKWIRNLDGRRVPVIQDGCWGLYVGNLGYDL